MLERLPGGFHKPLLGIHRQRLARAIRKNAASKSPASWTKPPSRASLWPCRPCAPLPRPAALDGTYPSGRLGAPSPFSRSDASLPPVCLVARSCSSLSRSQPRSVGESHTASLTLAGRTSSDSCSAEPTPPGVAAAHAYYRDIGSRNGHAGDAAATADNGPGAPRPFAPRRPSDHQLPAPRRPRAADSPPVPAAWDSRTRACLIDAVR